MNTTISLKKAMAAVAVAASTLVPGTAAAQQVSDAWRFGAVIYAYLPTIGGQSRFPADGSQPSVDVDVDQILDNLKFVFMGSFEAKKGRWGGFTDIIYMDVGTNRSGTRDIAIGGVELPASASASVNYDLKTWLWTFAGMYEVVSSPAATFDVFAGARMANLKQNINWGLDGSIGGIPVTGRTGESNASRTNWDGIIGMKGRWRFGSDYRWFVPYYVDVGTGNSDLTWQAMAGLGYSWKQVDVVAAWRYLDYDFGEGKPLTELNLNGPQIGVVFRW